jgi:hypothetical protein
MRLSDKPPFHERYRFAGKFICGNDSTPEVDVTIEFARLNSGPITGFVLGDSNTAAAFDRAFRWRKPCQLISSEDDYRQVVADGVLLTTLQQTIGGLNLPRGPIDRVVEFSCREVSETVRRTGPPGERGVAFTLAGPLEQILPPDVATRSWTGATTIRERDFSLDVGVPWPGQIELRHTYLWDGIDTADQQGRYARLPGLILRTNLQRSELSDAELLKQAGDLADDLTLLMSFVWRNWIVWFQYEFWRPDAATEHRFHRSRRTESGAGGFDNSPVGPNSREFLRRCLPVFRQNRDAGLDLRLPLVYAIPKSESRYVEERLASAFWSLEKLVNLLVLRDGRDRIFGSSRFDRIEKQLKAALESSTSTDSRWGDGGVGLALLRDKLPELNRPSFSAQLKWACHTAGVIWSDLYPPGVDISVPRFIRTRNEIFHSNAAIDGALVLRESLRVTAVIERLVLKLLGWDDLSGTGPSNYGISLDEEM